MGELFNVSDWLVGRHVRDGRGSKVAVRSDGRSWTYGQLQADVWAAGWGMASCGLRAGDRVVLVTSDSEEMIAAILGAMAIAAVPVPLSTMLTGPELAVIAADARASLLVVSSDYAAVAAPILEAAPTILGVVVIGDAAVDPGQLPAWRWDTWDDRRELPDAGTDKSSPALWLYTSGTTGRPKGAMHRHGSLRVTAETYGRSVLAATPEDRFYSVAKLFFAFGLGNSMTFPLAVGATTILDPGRPTPEGVARLAAEHRPTLLFAPPGFCAALADAEVPSEVLASVRLAVTAGETLPGELWQRFHDRFGVEILDGIGTTEALHIFCSNHPGDVRAGMTGRPVAGYDLKLLDRDDREITEAGVPGFLHVRGGSLASGYWQRPDETAAAFRNGWLRTGDVYSRDDEGYYRFHGRDNDMIKAGGIWVSPAEVEGVLLTHDDVLEAAVVGGRDAEGLEMVVAFVVPRRDHQIDPVAVIGHCRDRMAAFKRPRRVHVVDRLPKTATGKVQRYALRDQLAAAG